MRAEERRQQMERDKTLSKMKKSSRKSEAPPSTPTTSRKSSRPVSKHTAQKKKVTSEEDFVDVPSKTEVPVVYGPLNKMDYMKSFIEQQKKNFADTKIHENTLNNPEILEDIRTTSDVISREIERAALEKTANPKLVSAIQDREIEIGQKLLKALEDPMGKSFSIQREAGEIEEEFKDLYLNLTMLNKTTAKPVVANETLQKFNELRERASIIPQQIEAVNSQMADDTEESMIDVAAELKKRGLWTKVFETKPESLLDLMSQTADAAQNTLDHLLEIHPTNRDEQEMIQDLAQSNLELIEKIGEKVPALIEAIETDAPDLIEFSRETAAEIQEAINKSKEQNSKRVRFADTSNLVQEVAEIEDSKNLELDEILGQIDANFAEQYVPKDPKVRSYFGHDVEDELINLDEADTEFEGGTYVDGEEFFADSRADNRSRNERRESRITELFAGLDYEENLENIEGDFNALLDESELVLENAVEDLEESEEKIEDPEVRFEIQAMKKRAEEFLAQVKAKNEKAANAVGVNKLINRWERKHRGGNLESLNEEREDSS